MRPAIYLDAQKPSSLFLTGTRVDEWVDANGNGKSVLTGSNGTGFNPTFDSTLFGGKGGITFPGSKYLESASPFTALNWARGFTVLCAGQYFDKFFGLSDSAYILMGAGLGHRLGLGTGGNAYKGYPQRPCVFGVRWDRSKIQFILDGKIYDAREGSVTTGTGAFGKLQVGGLLPGGNINATMAALQIFDGALDDDDVSEQCALMKARHNIADLPTPMFNILVDGNSLAVGYWSNGVTTMWDGVNAFNAQAADDMLNFGNSGITTPQLTARAPTLIDPLLNLSVPAKRRMLIVWELTNDLSNLTQTDVAAYANIKAYCQGRKAAGPVKIIVATCLPRTQSGINSNFETLRLSLNTMIRTNAVAEGWADYVADIGGDATIGATGASDNTTYFNDKIHLTAAGHTIAKTYITAALTAVIV